MKSVGEVASGARLDPAGDCRVSVDCKLLGRRNGARDERKQWLGGDEPKKRAAVAMSKAMVPAPKPKARTPDSTSYSDGPIGREPVEGYDRGKIGSRRRN